MSEQKCACGSEMSLWSTFVAVAERDETTSASNSTEATLVANMLTHPKYWLISWPMWLAAKIKARRKKNK